MFVKPFDQPVEAEVALRLVGIRQEGEEGSEVENDIIVDSESPVTRLVDSRLMMMVQKHMIAVG
jgi:hypothetical protein